VGAAPDYLDRLARLAAQARFATLGTETVAATRDVVLDTLGAVLAGCRLPENARLASLAAERSGVRTATLIGHGERAEPMLAALANATAGVAFEMDEGNRWGGGHPAIHVLPAALAVAEEERADGPRLIESLVAGYEITSRLGAATTVRPNVHSHGTWGTVGAAVAVARLRGRDERAVRQAINLAASMSPANSWTPCFEGATIRNLYPGRAALQGILAVHLLDCGYGAPHDAPSDVFGTILGERFEPARALDDLAADEGQPRAYRIQRNYVKLHACCLYNHPALDALQGLLTRERCAPDAIARITVTSVPFVTRMGDPDPPNMLAAKFSVPYAVAAAVVTGGSGVAAFLDPAREDPRVRELARRVEVRGDPGMAMRDAGRPTARVEVALRDGRVLTQTTTAVRGDAENPVGRETLVEKFLALASPTLPADRARRVVQVVAELHTLKDVRDLTELLWTTS
jgi:2-methylcitrate dehydratase PrpD